MTDYPDYIGVHHGMRGYFAVWMCWDPCTKCYHPFNSSPFASSDRDAAVRDANRWAEAEGMTTRISD